MFMRLVALTAILLTPGIVFAQPLIDHVPADAMAYIGWRGSDDLGPGYDQSNLKAVMNDSNIPQFVDQFLPAAMDKIGQMNPEAAQVMPIIGAIARPTWKHPTALFFGLAKGPNGEPQPHGGVIWQPGADADALARQLDQLVQQANAPLPMKVVRQGQIVALMVGYENAQAALAGGAARSLAQSAGFKSAMAHVMKDPAAALYIDFQQLLGFVDQMAKDAPDPQFAQRWPKLRDTLGLSGLKREIVTSGFDGKDWGTQAFVEAPQPRTGLFKLFGGGPLGEDVLGAIPQTVTSAGAARFNAGGIVPLVRQVAAAMDPNAEQQLDGLLQGLTRQSGVDIEKDLLGSLGDEWAYYSDPMIGGRGMASLTIINHLKDPAKFEESMSKIEDFALAQIAQQIPGPAHIHLAFETVQVDGMTIHYLAVPLVAPSWVVHGGNLYVAAFPQIAAAAARHGAGKGSSILQNEGFVALRKRLGQQNPSSFSFGDLPKTAPDAYDTWLFISRLAGFGDLFGVKSPAMLLPELDKLQAHLAPAGSITWQEADGIHMRLLEPFPGSTLVAGDQSLLAIYAISLETSVLLPALNRAREQANRVKSASNLRQIGMGAIMYANNHNGRFPPDLGTIAADQDLAGDVFRNPRVDAHGPPPPADPKQLAQWVNQHADYVWVGAGKTAAAAADVPLAYENPEQNTGGLNILYADGHVEFFPMPQAQQEIQKARQGGGGGNL